MYNYLILIYGQGIIMCCPCKLDVINNYEMILTFCEAPKVKFVLCQLEKLPGEALRCVYELSLVFWESCFFIVFCFERGIETY